MSTGYAVFSLATKDAAFSVTPYDSRVHNHDRAHRQLPEKKKGRGRQSMGAVEESAGFPCKKIVVKTDSSPAMIRSAVPDA